MYRRNTILVVALAVIFSSAACLPGRNTTSASSQQGRAGTAHPRSTTPPNPNSPYGPTGVWQSVFSDHFSGSSLDTSKWSTCYFWDCTNRANPELEWYQASQVTVSEGAVSLTVVPQKTHGQQYVSGMLSSYGKFSFQYGYAQIVAKLPTGQGLWSAFWTTPASGKWPPEIDIMENVAEQDNINLYVHVANNVTSNATVQLPSFNSEFHTYGVDWEPGSITWYVDGVMSAYFAISITDPEYLIADLAVSGFAGPDASNRFPQSLVIRSIQVWQHPPLHTPPSGS